MARGHRPNKGGTCPLCERVAHLSNHHLIPKTRGTGPHVERICLDCHDAIHAFFSNKELEREYNTVWALKSNEAFAKHVAWIGKQDPRRRTKTKLRADQRDRGRNG